MKKILRMLAVLLLLALVLTVASCGEDPITPEKELWYTITPLYDTIVSGEKSQIKLISNADSISADFPEVKTLYYPINRVIESQPTQTTTYHVAFYINGKVADIANPKVYVRDPNLEDLLCLYGPWSMVKLEFQDGPGLPWYEADLWDCLKDNLTYFYLTPIKKMVLDRGTILCSDQEVRISEGPWSLNGNILMDQSLALEIITLTQDTLVWVYHPGGQQDATKETRVHPLKTKK